MHICGPRDIGLRILEALTRREVSGGMLAAALAVVVGVPHDRTSSARASVRLLDFAIAGGHYHGLYQALPSLTTGTRLALVREPENPYDSNAVAVHLAAVGLKLGFVPRAANPPVARLIDRGMSIRAEVAGVLDVWRDSNRDDFAFTGFASGDPLIRLTVERGMG
jgi:hypothetical protein